MPLGDGGVAVTTEEEIHLASKSRRFLNGLSIFHSKRAAASTAHHRRGASLDSSISASRSHWQPKFCEQTRLEATKPSVRPVCSDPHHESSIRSAQCEISKDKDPSRGRASLWVRIVGRFAGKSKVVEETSASPATVVTAKPSSKVRSQPKKYKWVSCEDLSRVISSEKDRRHDELIKPVLEPVHFTPAEEPTRKIDSQRRKVKPDQRVIEECKSAASHLRSKKASDQSAAAVVARALASTHPVARSTLTSLGAIAPLVAMLDSSSCRSTALLTLHALASGNDPNKAAIVDAGAIPKMLPILETRDADSVVANLVSLSALDRNKPLLASAIPPLVARLGRDSLRALYNLSLAQSNVKVLVESNAAAAVMATLTMHLADEKALAILGNMVATTVGRNSVASSGIEPLISALGFGDKCQELASYILMVIAHHSPEMVERRAIPALLEVSLLGSALAQKRAVRVLECLREDRSERPVSAPVRALPPHARGGHSDSIPKLVHVGEGSKIVNHMVRESLERNLERIVRRANLPLDHVSSLQKCRSSKSLPF